MGCIKTGGMSNPSLLTVRVLSCDGTPLISFLSPILLSQDSLLPQEIIIKVEREDSGPMAVPSQVSWTHGLFTLRNVCGWLVAEARLK